MTLHCVYYCYNADNEILYIGCTKRIVNRLYQHKSGSAWVHALHKIRLRWFDGFWEARRFEEKAIWRNRPEYNRLEADDRGERRFWVKPKRELPILDDDCLIRLKLIQKSVKKRHDAALERMAKRVEKREQKDAGK